MNDSEKPKISSTCACKKVSVEFTGQPITQMLCSCKDCQKASGGGHATLALFPANAVNVKGDTKSFSVTANSGATTNRHFCPDCGTPIFGSSSRFPHLMLLPVGFFEDSSWVEPKSLIFARSHLDWDKLDANLPQYDTYKEG